MSWSQNLLNKKKSSFACTKKTKSTFPDIPFHFYNVLDHTNQIFSLNIAQCSLSIWPNSTDDWSHSQLAPSLRSHSQLVFHSTGPYSSASVQLVPQAPGPRINWSLESTSPPVIVYWSPSQLVHYWVRHAKCNWSSFEKQRIQTNTNTMPQFV